MGCVMKRLTLCAFLCFVAPLCAPPPPTEHTAYPHAPTTAHASAASTPVFRPWEPGVSQVRPIHTLTSQETKNLKADLQTGKMSNVELGRKYRITYNTLWQFKGKHGGSVVRKKNMGPSSMAEVYQKYMDSKQKHKARTDEEIALDLGISKSQLQGIKMKYKREKDFVPPKKKHAAAAQDAIHALEKRGTKRPREEDWSDLPKDIHGVDWRSFAHLHPHEHAQLQALENRENMPPPQKKRRVKE